jgi:hypothetical protein
MMGESLGAGVATIIIIAARYDAAALVLDAPYLSALDVAGDRYPIFPVGYLMRDPFRSDLAIVNVHAPVPMLHGEQDPIIPIASARKLFELAHEPKQFIAVPGAGHLVPGLDGVYPRVKAFIDAHTVEAP